MKENAMPCSHCTSPTACDSICQEFAREQMNREQHCSRCATTYPEGTKDGRCDECAGELGTHGVKGRTNG